MNLHVDFQLDFTNHLSKCRCCFKELSEAEQSPKIDDSIQKFFFELTQMNLVDSDEFSSRICHYCFQDLHNYSRFRSNLIQKQTKLYEFVHPGRFDSFADCKESALMPRVKIEVQDDDDTHDYADYPPFLTDTLELPPSHHTDEPKFKLESTTAIDFLPNPHNFCEICQIQTSGIRRHVQKFHEHMKKFFCDICDYSGFFKHDLVGHMKSHTVKRKYSKEQQTFYCESCGQKFDKRFHLNAHVKAKHTEKVRSHVCGICGKAFFSTENLKKHVESHNQKQLPCEYCGKLFSCINNLRTHLYYHSEPKFVCELEGCDKKFFMRKRLRAHMKTHLNQKDFLCNYCEKSYFSQNDLNRHIFSIHQKLRFFCEEDGCQGNFSRREYYKKHAMTHHQNLGPERLELLLQKIRDAIPLQKAM